VPKDTIKGTLCVITKEVDLYAEIKFKQHVTSTYYMKSEVRICLAVVKALKTLIFVGEMDPLYTPVNLTL
jgi:hypothetical protein